VPSIVLWEGDEGGKVRGVATAFNGPSSRKEGEDGIVVQTRGLRLCRLMKAQPGKEGGASGRVKKEGGVL